MKKKSLYKIGVVSHNANVWDSNHLACSNIGVIFFCHLCAKRMLTHVFSLFKSDAPCRYYLKCYFSYSSCVYKDVCTYFQCNYDVRNVADNSL